MRGHSSGIDAIEPPEAPDQPESEDGQDETGRDTGAERCGDGMSDREYGLGATLMVGAGPGMELYAGCCTLAGR